MLYHLFDWLQGQTTIPGLRVFQYLTFRAVLAGITSLFLSIYGGKVLIKVLRRKLIGESIREVGPESHKSKKGTPTMGGLIILIAILLPTLLWGDLTNFYVLLILFATLWMGVVGFTDDYIKVFRKNKAGLKGKFKLMGQVGLGLIVGLTMVNHPHFKGIHSHVRKDYTINVTETLRAHGFQQNDKLLRMDGESVQDKPELLPIKEYHSYAVERQLENSSFKYQHVLSIPRRDRETVAQELLGSRDESYVTKTNVPFLKGYTFDYASLAFWTKDPSSFWVKFIYVLVVIFIVTAVSNGVNITDGLDGLAAGTTAIVCVVLGLFVYVSGNLIFARYLNITFIPYSGELFIFCAALVCACIGFLWYNTYPAQVFMGDTGSLALGGAVGVLALMVKKELLLPLICGVFFIENLSVIVQVFYFKYTKRKYGQGRRIFRMAPLHHHYELGGLHEAKIVTRFWIVTILLEILAFSTLKLR